MSDSITSTTSLLAAAKKAAVASSATSTSSASTSSSDASATASSALSSIAGNFNSFLTMLTTQLKNQDPSSPMNSDTFTSELATFAGVQQQVNTNTNLATIISLNQDAQVTANTGLVGERATFTGSQIPLQSGKGSINFTTAAAEPIAIAITDASGNVVRTVQQTSAAGSNSWAWDGKDDAGNTLSNGTYNIALLTQDTTGVNSSVPFTVNGVITGVSKSSSGVSVQMGSETIDMNNVNSLTPVGAAATSS